MVDINRTGCLVCGGAFHVGDHAQIAGRATPEGPSGGGWYHLRCRTEYQDLQAEAVHQAGIDFEGHQNGELSTYQEDQLEQAVKDIILEIIQAACDEAYREEDRLGRTLTATEVRAIANMVEGQFKNALALANFNAIFSGR
jgi:hypothetical protein